MGSSYISIGEMKSTGTFSRLVGAASPTGGRIESQTGPILSPGARGKLTKKGGRREIEGGHLTIVKTYLWQCYFQSAIDSELLKQNMQWAIDGMVFRVVDWEQIDNRFFEFTLVKNEDYTL